MENHTFEQGHNGCMKCGKKHTHLIHKAPKPKKEFFEGEIVNDRFVVTAKGPWIRL